MQLAPCDYIRHKRNALMCGPAGVGKTYLAQALAHEACRQGFDVLFTDTHKMLRHINGGRADGSLDKRLQTYLRPDLLVLDDFGLGPMKDVLGIFEHWTSDQGRVRVLLSFIKYQATVELHHSLLEKVA